MIDVEQVFWNWKYFMNFEKILRILRNFMNFHAQNSLIRLALHFFAYQVVTCNKIIQTNWTVWKWIEPFKSFHFSEFWKSFFEMTAETLTWMLVKVTNILFQHEVPTGCMTSVTESNVIKTQCCYQHPKMIANIKPLT